MIIDTNHPKYMYKYQGMSQGRFNGAYYYAKEIENNIIPRIKTDRNWVTIKVEGECFNHSIVFIHRNVNLEESYGYLKDYEDLVLVCSNPNTQKFMERYGKAIFLPLSVDVSYVLQFKANKTEKACYAGNIWDFKKPDLARLVPPETHCLTAMPREELLKKIARYEECYAIGRTAIEAKILGCKLRVCDSRYPDTEFWKVVDNKESAEMLQKMLGEIDL